ncbi:MAG: PLD nuclease N-terminal domain-containing protein [Microbacterium sp.]
MPRALILLAVAALVFWVFTLVDCAVQPRWRHRGVSKPLWIVIVAVLPVVGGVLWLVIGRTRPDAQRVIAPDDDPDFLGTLGGATRLTERERAEQDLRIRRLEEEFRDDRDHPDGAAGRADGDSTRG